MSARDNFIGFINELVDNKINFKLILSKPRPGIELRSSSIQCLDENNNKPYIALEKSMTQHFTKNFDSSSIKAYITTSLKETFYYGELISELHSGLLLQNNKGTSTYINKANKKIDTVAHNKVKEYIIPENADFLIKLGISSTKGKVFEQSQKKYRQINKFIEIIDGLLDKKMKSLKIMDMGSGKAYLSFATYYHLKYNKNIDVELIGYELRNELVNKCNNIAKELNYDKMNFIQANILEIKPEKVDMIISLHACDVATDMAINAGLKANAKMMVIAPCCHKQIRGQIKLKNGILKHGILLERTAEMVTDAIRALILEDRGYSTKIFEFISSEHTAKNTMIIAKKTYKRNQNALLEIQDIKDSYGIDYHFLEKLVYDEVLITYEEEE